jgi:hypothetical protein
MPIREELREVAWLVSVITARCDGSSKTTSSCAKATTRRLAPRRPRASSRSTWDVGHCTRRAAMSLWSGSKERSPRCSFAHGAERSPFCPEPEAQCCVHEFRGTKGEFAGCRKMIRFLGAVPLRGWGEVAQDGPRPSGERTESYCAGEEHRARQSRLSTAPHLSSLAMQCANEGEEPARRVAVDAYERKRGRPVPSACFGARYQLGVLQPASCRGTQIPRERAPRPNKLATLIGCESAVASCSMCACYNTYVHAGRPPALSREFGL